MGFMTAACIFTDFDTLKMPTANTSALTPKIASSLRA